MTAEDFFSVAFVLLVMQAISYNSVRSVLGSDAGWKVNNLLGLGCFTSIWGSIYIGAVAESVVVWVLLYVAIVAGIVKLLRVRSSYAISIKQALLIYGGVILRLIIVAATIGAVIRIVMLVIKRVAAAE